MIRYWLLLVLGVFFFAALSVLAAYQSTLISREVADEFESFTFSDKAFSLMRSRSVPEDVIVKLEPLTDQTTVGIQNFSDLLRDRLAPSQADRFDDLIRRCTQLRQLDMDQEKLRQEAIDVAVGNERRKRFWMILYDNVGAALTVVVAVIGVAVGLFQYVSLRRKEAADRASDEFIALYEKLASAYDRDVASALAGMQKFLAPEHKRFHSQVAGGLALVGRLEYKTTAMRKTLRPVLERAFRGIDPAILKTVSWQKLELHNISFRDADLSDLDLTDSVLEGSDFSCAILNNTTLERANLRRCNFSSAKLCDANLANADLSETDLSKAVLSRTNLLGATLVGTDFQGAQLCGAKLTTDIERTDWAFCKNWRAADFGAAVEDRLTKIYGPGPKGPRILMILWEFPPAVSGGAWTAALHLIRNLRQKGSDITVLTPWKEASQYSPFGQEIPVIHTEMQGTGVSAYSSYSAYSVYTGNNTRSIIRDTNLFTNKIKRDFRFWERKEFDIIHAHDWLTFEAARWLSAQLDRPWIAHIHSTEKIRQREQSRSNEIERIERRSCKRQEHPAPAYLVVPSQVLKRQIIADYEADEDGIEVVPNTISRIHHSNRRLGSFASHKVVFVGRLSWQKAPERFVKIADLVRSSVPHADFVMYGEGEEAESIEQLINCLHPPNPVRVSSCPEWFGFSRLVPIEERCSISPLMIDYLRLEGVPDGLLNELNKLERETRTGKCVEDGHVHQLFAETGEEATLDAEKLLCLIRQENRGKPLTEIMRQQTETRLRSRGFLVTPVQADKLYTHRVKTEATYSLSEAVISRLQQLGIPADVTDTLTELLAQGLSDGDKRGSQHILEHVRAKLGDRSEPFERTILTQSLLEPEESFLTTIEPNWLPAYGDLSERFVSLGGFQKWGDLKLTYENATVLVVPSRHEPFGMVILEAMWCGVPVIYCQQAGAAEVFQSGIRVDVEDTAAAAAEVEKLLTDESHWVSVVEAQLAEMREFGLKTRNQYEERLKEIWDVTAATRVQSRS